MLTPQQVVDRLRAAFPYVDVSREEAIEHYRAVAAHMDKLGGMPEFMRQEQERLPEAVRVIIADSDPRQSDCPFLWFIAKPRQGTAVETQRGLGMRCRCGRGPGTAMRRGPGLPSCGDVSLQARRQPGREGGCRGGACRIPGERCRRTHGTSRCARLP